MSGMLQEVGIEPLLSALQKKGRPVLADEISHPKVHLRLAVEPAGTGKFFRLRRVL